MSDDPLALRKALERLSLSNMRALCHDLGVDPELLTTGSKADLARELVAYFQRRNDLPTLVRALARYGEVLAPLAIPLDHIPAIRQLPRGSRIALHPNPRFVGRDDTLVAIAAAILAKPVVLAGGGGFGKTQIAAEFAYRYGPFFAGGVFWLNCANPQTITDEIAACGHADAMALPGFETLTPEQQAKRVRGAWARATPRLLILDDCADEQTLDAIRPTSGGCRVLATSRSDLWDDKRVTLVPLPPLARDASIALVRHYRDDLAPDDAGLNALAAELGDLPLALHLAGSYLRRYRRVDSLESYLAELREAKLLGHRSLGDWPHHLGSPTDHDQHIERTFRVSFRQLDLHGSLDALAAGLLGRAARFTPGLALPRQLLMRSARSARPHDLVDALERLHELGLLERLSDEAVRLHQLLARFADDALPPDMIAAAAEDAEEIVVDLLGGWVTLDDLGDPATLTSHLQTVVGEAFDRYERADRFNNAALIQLLADTRMVASGMGELVRARHERLLRRINDPKLAMQSMSRLSQLAIQSGDRQRAKEHLDNALELADEVNDPEYRSGLLGNMSNLYEALGQLDTAITVLEQALAFAREVGNRSLEAKWLVNLGRCVYERGEIERAQTLATQSHLLAGDDQDLAALGDELLVLCASTLGRVSEAAEHYARRLDTARQRGDVVREGLALGNLGDCRAAMGEYAAAERDLRQALDLCRKADQRRNEAHVLHSLAELLVDTGRFAEAIQCARDGQALAESISNPRLAAEHAAALARAALLAGDLTLALAAAQAADAGPRPWLAALDAAALLGVAQTVSGQHEAAQQSFAESLRHAEALLAHTPALPSALDTQGLAHAGLALLASPDHLAPARQAFEMAGHAAHAPGLAHRTLTLLDVLVGLAGGERLDELRQPLVARLAPSSQ